MFESMQVCKAFVRTRGTFLGVIGIISGDYRDTQGLGLRVSCDKEYRILGVHIEVML